MEWPSKNVQQGGILHPPKASYSPETHQFLKVLMDESKLSMFQRKKMNYYLRNGEPLPLPTSSRSSDDLRPKKKLPAVLIRPGTSKRRSKETILNSGAYEREKFRPRPHVDREKEKDRLQNRMAFGKDIQPRKPRKIKEKKTDKDTNRFDQLVSEIKEREEWLRQMEELGEGDKHRLIIEQQIQARIREMETLKLEDSSEAKT